MAFIRVDRRKVEEARHLLKTGSVSETVDAALDEVINLSHRRKLMERIRKEGGLGPGPKELRRFELREVVRYLAVALLHYDRHFDLISRATGQPAEWLARRGSLG